MAWNATVSYRFVVLGLLALLASACATTPQTGKTEADMGPVFYPNSPNPPRIQHLARIAAKSDLIQEDSRLAAFVAGEERSDGLRHIYGTSLFNGKLYVSELTYPGIAVFDLLKKTFNVIQGPASTRIRLPAHIAVDADGTKYITDSGRDAIHVYDREDRFINVYGEIGQYRPVGIAIAGDRLYVTDLFQRNVRVLDKSTGRILSSFPDKDATEGKLVMPADLEIAANGDVLVVDSLGSRVQRYSADGKWLRSIGEAGDGHGMFARPKGIAVDKQGRIYVADAATQAVQVFDNDAKLLMGFGQSNKMEGLSLPTAVAIDYANVDLFRRFAAPKFDVEYLILVASNQAPAKVDVFGFGRMQGMEYPEDKPKATAETKKP